MEMEITVHGDIHDDSEMLKTFVNARGLASAIYEAKELIRTRLKWHEGLPDEEERFLEELRDVLTSDELF